MSEVIVNNSSRNSERNKMVNINFRSNQMVKRRAEEVCKEMGMPMSSALNAFLRYLGTHRRIPFEIALDDPWYDDSNQAYLHSQIEGVRKGEIVLEQHELVED